jgi:probable HAF family extracellular repeat protein
MPGNTVPHAFLYTGTPGSGGHMIDLGSLAGYSFGWGINASGQVVGETGGGSGAFLYTGIPGTGGHMIDLGDLGGMGSRALAINASGQITGYSVLADMSTEDAFLYTGTPGVDGHMVDLGNLGGTYSEGVAINASGQIAGTSGTGAFYTPDEAFLYTGTPGSGGHMTGLGFLQGVPDGHSYAKGINDFGQVVGYSVVNLDELDHAFLYTGTPGVDGHMLDLDTWLHANNPAGAANWTLTSAVGINDSGWITGVGNYNDGPGGLPDGPRAYLLDASSLIPEPAMAFPLATLLCAVVSLRRFRNGHAPCSNSHGRTEGNYECEIN